jgi:CDP-diacylglycerol--serine O-phosphatidyltransferase
VVAVLVIALLVSYPWHLLTAGTLAYLILLPLGWVSYQRQLRPMPLGRERRRDTARERGGRAAAAAAAGDERPTRLN